MRQVPGPFQGRKWQGVSRNRRGSARGLFYRILVYRCHCCDLVSDISHFIGSQDLFIIDQNPVWDPGGILGRDDRFYPCKFFCPAGVNMEDPGMGVGSVEPRREACPESENQNRISLLRSLWKAHPLEADVFRQRITSRHSFVMLLFPEATERTASTIFTYPVHRQKWPARAFLISCSEGLSFSSRRALLARIIPGVQNPH